MNPAHFLDNTGKQTWLFITEGEKKERKRETNVSILCVSICNNRL